MEGRTGMKWLVIHFDRAGIKGSHVLDLVTSDVDEAAEAADEWEDENFGTLGCTQVLTIDEVKDLSRICREVLASFTE